MKANWAILKTAIDGFSHYGDVGISVQSPTGEVWSRQGDIQFPAASIAKIPIMITVYRMIDQNQLALDNEYVLQNVDKSNGSGVLRHMRTGMVLTLSDLIFLMISISDNTATNILIRKVGIDIISATMKELRMNNSNLSRYFVGRLAIEGEQENYATPNDYVRVLDTIVSGEAASASACQAMLTTLSLQQNRNRIGRYVPTEPAFRWGSKTGTNPGITNDVGFVTSSLGTMRIAILCRGLESETVGEQLIADSTLAAMQSTGMIAC